MAGKSISGWYRLALGSWASRYVKWLFSPKGSGIFWAKAFWRETNLSGGRASNNTQSLAPWKEGVYQVLLGTTASSPRVSTEGDQHRWLIYEQQGDQGDTAEMQSLICQRFQNSSEATCTNFFEKKHASESSEKRMACWCPGFPRRNRDSNTQRGSPASQMRGKESQQSPK